MNHLGPIFRALLRNKVGAVLIALQVAVTMTIVVNAIHLISSRSDLIARDSGLDESNQFYITTIGYDQNYDARYVTDTDLDSLRQLPGVVDAVQINALPMSNSGSSTTIKNAAGEDAGDAGAALYYVDDHALNTMGIELLAGENFNATDITWREMNKGTMPQKIMITATLAQSLFPDLEPEQVVDKTLFNGDDEPMTVIGVIKQLHAPWVGWGNIEHAMLVPQKSDSVYAHYLVRTEPGQRATVMPEALAKIEQRDVGRMVLEHDTMTQVRADSYRNDTALQSILWAIIVTLMLITALGIVGLISFTINRRRRQIGTRRALGASRGDIMSYFLTENLLITLTGVVIGGMGSVGLNIVLVNNFDLPRLDYIYLPIAMVCLVVVGLAAVFGPALRAAHISPATATRNI
ncbi:putative ABC transport system permease protein [Idiomarina aquatica]|uniref:Putative ABC transport system permease protein n=1 Tax=Idiomarina aquatica TaxID=1327752 RepID=A0A4R6PKZ7_9GAMM|nr:FtsX-like permease family protein [Idiomarina aquatica]TDP39137.1 putative ABC transport system permease protein [Idiomarina aquatica]